MDYFDGKDGAAGKEGASVTITNVTESSADGGNNVVTFSNGQTLTVKNGSKGNPGADGKTPVKGVDYFDGKDGAAGKDGASVTITNVTESSADGGNNVVTFSDGQTLTVKNGSKGNPGANGTSVTVKSVSQSNEDGGSNVVTFSDGKTLTIKNGSKGSPGEGGSGGGSSSKYEQPEWGGEHVENYAYMPETELTVIEDVGAALVMSEVTGITAGESYTVIYNGTEYVCEAINVEGTGIVLGNAGALFEGMPITEDPFMVMMVPEDVRENFMGAYVMVAPLDGSAIFTLAIVGEKDIVHAIPAKYLEAASKPLIVSVDFDATKSDTDFATIHEAAFAGRLVYLNWRDELRALSYIDNATAHFTRVKGWSNGGAHNIDVQTIIINGDNTVSTLIGQLTNQSVT